MSEFKYACPVCGQHIKCDSSQEGTQMECPTCFQKITVPQAPTTEEQKFIITGTKKGERPVSKLSEESSRAVPAAKGFPGVLVVGLILLFIGTAVAFIYHGTIFKSRSGWTLNLDGVTIPDTPAAGQIHGRNFTNDRAVLQNGELTLRAGTRGTMDFGVIISVGNAPPEKLAGTSLNVGANAPTASRVTMHWPDDGNNGRQNLEKGYALRLDFVEVTNNRLSGEIYFCAPDEMKSYVAGTFNAEIRRSRPRTQN